MIRLVDTLRNSTNDEEIINALQALQTLAGCPVHAYIILDTPDAVSALVSLVQGGSRWHEHFSLRETATNVLRLFANGSIHGAPRNTNDNTPKVDDHIQAVVEAGGIQVRVLDVCIMLYSQFNFILISYVLFIPGGY